LTDYGEDKMGDFYWLPSIKIRGYRPFADLLFQFKPLQVIVREKRTFIQKLLYIPS